MRLDAVTAPTAKSGLRVRRAGHALLVHRKGRPDPMAVAFAESLVPDQHREVAVVDLPPGASDKEWDAVCRALASHQDGIRLVFTRGGPPDARRFSQTLAERTGGAVLAVDGTVRLLSDGGLFVPHHAGAGWLRYLPRRAPAYDSRRFPKPHWEYAVADRPWNPAAGAVVEPIVGGLWLRGAAGAERHWLVDRIAGSIDLLTAVLGSPGGPPVELPDAVRTWHSVMPSARPRLRFLQLGPVTLPDGVDSLGQGLADGTGEQVVFYSGVPAWPHGGEGAVSAEIPNRDGSAAWRPFAAEIVYSPRAGGAPPPPVLMGVRPPVEGVPATADGVYPYASRTVLEVVQSGLWLRPPEEPAGGARVRRLAAAPGRAVILYDRETPESSGLLRELAEDMLRQLGPELREAFRVAPADAPGTALGWGDPDWWAMGAEVPDAAGSDPAPSAAGAAGGRLEESASGPASARPDAAVATAPPAAAVRPVAEPPRHSPGGGRLVTTGGPPQSGSEPFAHHASATAGELPPPVPDELVSLPGPHPLPDRSSSPAGQPPMSPDGAAHASTSPGPDAPTPPDGSPTGQSPTADDPGTELGTLVVPGLRRLSPLRPDAPDGEPPVPAGAAGPPPAAPGQPPAAPPAAPPPAVRGGAPRIRLESEEAPHGSPAARTAQDDREEPLAAGRRAPEPRTAVRVQPVPPAAASAVPPERGLERERDWLRKTYSAQFDALSGSVSRVMSESPGLRSVSREQSADALTDLVAVRLYLNDDSGGVDAAVRSAAVGPHVPLARCVSAGLQRLQSYRGPALMHAPVGPEELAWFHEGRLTTEWAFCTASTVPYRSDAGTADFLIWSMTARRTRLVAPSAAGQVVFVPGTRFKVLRTDAGERPAVLLREVSSSELTPDGRLTAGRMPLDEMALTGLSQVAESLRAHRTATATAGGGRPDAPDEPPPPGVAPGLLPLVPPAPSRTAGGAGGASKGARA